MDKAISTNIVVFEQGDQIGRLYLTRNSDNIFVLTFSLGDLKYEINIDNDPVDRISGLINQGMSIFKIYLILYLEDKLKNDKALSGRIEKIVDEIMQYSIHQTNKED